MVVFYDVYFSTRFVYDEVAVTSDTAQVKTSIRKYSTVLLP